MSIRIGISILALTTLLSGCQSKVYLMPTPIVLTSSAVDAYDAIPDKGQSNTIAVFYASNRTALGLRHDRKYITGAGDHLHLGVARIRFGDKAMPWDTLRSQSSTAQRNKKISINLEQASELGTLKPEHNLKQLSEQSSRFINAVNRALTQSESKDITVYVHGATANFAQTMAQAAQIQHFTGRSHLVLVLAWPTAENVFRYSTDVKNTALTVPLFSHLLRFLANHTHAEYINVLAYSAGAQIVSPGLHALGMQYAQEPIISEDTESKLGEVYFAAPDIDLQTFVRQLPAYKRYARNVTLAVNINDFVLRMAQSHHGVSRAGLPDANELSPEQTQWIVNASINNTFDLIDVSSADMPSFGARSHDFWYSHPWISSDVLVQLLFHVGPAERGLLPLTTEKGAIVWYYPADYPERIVNTVLWLTK